MLVRINGVEQEWSIGEVESRWSGELEEYRNKFINRSSAILTSIYFGFTTSHHAYAKSTEAVAKIRAGFGQLMDVFTAIAEPILWFYALTGCILMATGKNKDVGWNRIKQVFYAYIAIALLPTFFAFARWVAELIGASIGFQ